MLEENANAEDYYAHIIYFNNHAIDNFLQYELL